MRRFIRFEKDGEVGRAEVASDGQLDVIAGPGAAQIDDVKLLAPVQPTKIIGVGRNYRDHAKELGNPVPQSPLLFFKPPSAVIGPGEAIIRPSGFDQVHYEGELAVVIDRPARHVAAADALDIVRGYTCLNDVTVRDLQKTDGQFTRAKGFDSFCPIGPWLVTDIDASDVALTTKVDGQVRQQARTSQMIFSIAQLIETITRVMTLQSEDVIATGTPAGVGQIEPGSEVAITVEHVGTLRNPVRAEVP